MNHANLKCKPGLTEKQSESQVAKSDLAHPSPVCSCLTSMSAIVSFWRPAGKSLQKIVTGKSSLQADWLGNPDGEALAPFVSNDVPVDAVVPGGV